MGELVSRTPKEVEIDPRAVEPVRLLGEIRQIMTTLIPIDPSTVDGTEFDSIDLGNDLSMTNDGTTLELDFHKKLVDRPELIGDGDGCLAIYINDTDETGNMPLPQLSVHLHTDPQTQGYVEDCMDLATKKGDQVSEDEIETTYQFENNQFIKIIALPGQHQDGGRNNLLQKFDHLSPTYYPYDFQAPMNDEDFTLVTEILTNLRQELAPHVAA